MNDLVKQKGMDQWWRKLDQAAKDLAQREIANDRKTFRSKPWDFFREK